MKRKTVGIVVFDDVEVLDFTGPFEVFSVTRIDPARRREETSPFDVKLISEAGGMTRAAGELKVQADFTLADCPKLDILVVPGGWGTRREMRNSLTIDWIRTRAAEVELLTSVCTRSLLLGSAGLLDGKRATTHWQALEFMRQQFPAVTVIGEEHVVEDGPVMTSAGISAGIDMALRCVARVCGESAARDTAAFMEYPFPETNARRVRIPPGGDRSRLKIDFQGQSQLT